ncbi:MAG: protein kinase [Desulfobacterales bacterium]|nr:protein kinase [Desulfobacterales bacterium]
MEKQKLGKYRIQSLLDTGGMADIYLAEHELLKNKVVVKTLPAETASSEEMVARFFREARAAAGLSHPNIIRVHDVGRAGGVFYIAMDYVDGSTLAHLIETHGALPEDTILGVGAQVLAALEEAHGNNVIHRDLKPDNIMIDRRGDAIVMDFGVAGMMMESDLTVADSFVGTVLYTSPEQILGKKAGEGSDIYSWGVVMYEMAAGRVPFPGPEMAAILQQHLNETPVPPIEINPNISPTLSTVILKSLEKRPEDRFKSAREMLTALEEPVYTRTMAAPPPFSSPREEEGPAKAPQKAPSPPGAKKKAGSSRRPMAVAILAAFIALSGVLAWHTGFRGRDTSIGLNVYSENGKKKVRLGEELSVCFQSKKNGFLYLFYQAPGGLRPLEQIYPFGLSTKTDVIKFKKYPDPDPDSRILVFIPGNSPLGVGKIKALETTKKNRADDWGRLKPDKRKKEAKKQKAVLTFEIVE